MEENSKIENSPFFTVFIGLYNSEKVIHRFFESVKKQTYRDFELIIIDDCSKDNTEKVTEKFVSSLSDIEVTFLKHKVNRGIAFSRKEAVNIAKGEVFVKWDHDDIQDKNQLTAFREAYLKYKSKGVAAVWCLCKDMQGNVVGNEYPKNEVLGNYFTMYSKYIMSTPKKPRERHNCISLEAHKKIYSFLREEKILPENVEATATDFWSGLALMGYKTVYINKPLRQYFIENDRPRMSNSGRNKNAKRVFLDRITWINHYMRHLPARDISWRIRLFLSIAQYGHLSGMSLKEILSKIPSFPKKLIVILFNLPVKILVKIRDGK
jgi:glycosyltransferase involved in cell wall biosynthesis